MKRTSWLIYLPVILAPTCLAPISLTQAFPAAPVQIAQVAEYDKYMRLGYAATVRRDYRTALINFRQALDVRPGDRYANNAIGNVSSYVERQAGTRLSVRPIGIGAPSNPVGGAVRGDACSSGEKPLTALVRAGDLGLTTAAYPSVFVYFPQTSAEKVELAVLDENDKQIGKTMIDRPTTPGIVSLSLSAIEGLPPLESGKNYHLFVSMICNAEDRSKDINVDGWVRRIEVDPILASELKTLAPRDRVSLYAVDGLWYDAIAALYEARQSSPQDSSLTNDLVDILKSDSPKLGEIANEIANEPLVGTFSRN